MSPVFKPNRTAEEMFNAADAAYNQNESATMAAKADAIAFVGSLISGTKAPAEVQEAIDANCNPDNDWYTHAYAQAFQHAWDSLYSKLTF